MTPQDQQHIDPTTYCDEHGTQPVVDLGNNEFACTECYQEALRNLKASAEEWRKLTGVYPGGTTEPPPWFEVLK